MSAPAPPPALPSVLAHPPTHAPPPSPAPSSTAVQVRCSQCKKDKPLDDYPLRLINLVPYQVCTAHAWYWTAAKQHSQWAPTRRTPFVDVCSEVSMAGASAQGKWLVDGAVEDRPWFVEQLAAAGNWTPKEGKVRPTAAKGDAIPSPTWIYSLWPSSTSSAPAPAAQELFKLQLWYHESARAFTMTLMSDGASKAPGPWSRPGRVRPSQAPPAPAAPPAAPTPSHLPLSFESASASRAPARSRTAVPPPQQSSHQFVPSAPSLVAARNADRDREQMPPPPVPSARPAKKARRVEPQLVSPVPTSSGSSGLITPFSAAHAEWSHFLSFPTLVQQPQPSSAPPAQQPHRDSPLDPLLLASLVQPSPSSTSTQHAPTAPSPAQDFRPLSLAELLSSAIFEPPIIDLPPRPPPTHHARSHAHAPVSRSGRELDAAVADALGATPDTLGGDGSASGSDEDEGRGYYEDSIPDESSADEDDEGAEGAGDAADGASVSSFFESSAEETEYGSGDERALSADDDDEEGEDNWLEGFAAQQMGLGPRRGAGRGRGRRAEELEEEEDEGNDELSEGEAPAAPPARRTRAATSAMRTGAQQSRRAVGAAQDEDEVDELDSPSSGAEERQPSVGAE
ncbi:hypothetical protein JCM9279_007165 [Rhodotorula babjevae]